MGQFSLAGKGSDRNKDFVKSYTGNHFSYVLPKNLIEFCQLKNYEKLDVGIMHHFLFDPLIKGICRQHAIQTVAWMLPPFLSSLL